MLHVFSTNTKETTSRQLQDSLIDYCLTKGSWSYNRMAGKLYISILYKDIFNSSVPLSLKETHEKLVSVGLMSDDFKNAFSDEDYVELEKIIDHSKDLTYAHYQIKQIMKKYSLMDRTQNIFYESPQQVYMRVAMRMCQNKGTGKQRLTRIKRHYKMYCDGIVNIPTPYFTNAGTKRSGFLSCFPAGSLVTTINGRKPIETVLEGDLVLTHTDTYKPNLHLITKEYDGKFVYLNTTASYNNELCSTENHRIFGLKLNSVSCLKNTDIYKPEWIRADNYRIGDYIKLNYDRTVLDPNLNVFDVIKNHLPCEGYLLEDSGKITKRTYEGKERSINNITNFNIYSEEFFRLLGYYLAEGHYYDKVKGSENVGFTFNINESEYIRDVKEILESFGAAVSIVENTSDNSTKITTSSKVISSALFLLCGKHSGSKILSKEIYLAPLQYQKQLLSGVIRGDGSTVISGFTLTLHNKELMYQLRDICLRCEYYFCLTSYKKIPIHSKTLPYNIRINVSADSELAQLVNKDLHKMRQTKVCVGSYNILYREDGAYGRVRLIQTENKKCTVYDLSVEKDHSYTVNGVAVHNCNLHTSDDTIGSLSAGDHISYMMTVGSAGQGSKIYTRTIGTPVKGGAIVHSGKINYYRTQVAMINANLQNGRGGAETQYYDCFDPEWKTIQKFKNQMTPLERQVRGLDYSMCFNSFFLNKAARNEDIAVFDYGRFPDLYKAMAEPTSDNFERIYNNCLALGLFETFVNAREILLGALIEALSTGRHYLCNLTEMNRHTPFKEPIVQSNLCGEIKLSTKAYNEIIELYWPRYLEDKETPPAVKEWIQEQVDKTEGETATCALSAISIGKVKNQEVHKEAAWVALDMIHTAITETDYMLPHIKYTSTKRMSAGVGMMDLAHALAKRKLSYDSQEGRNFIHQVSESQYWWLLEASLELSKEFGVAEWMHKTKWTDNNSWLPLDTYNRNVDSLITCGLQHNWDDIRQRIIENGGHAFSVLSSDMPKLLLGI